jgi:predicted O-linked N-acetylglucosamine transferase (SPINDLY family)
VYQTNALADAVTQRLKPLVHAWRVMDNISDAGLAEVIFSDGIDVLLDLSGHTHAHSLACFHLRPAPVQLTYLGYPNVTGVRNMDGRIVDEVTDPPGCESGFAQACERLVRMKRVFLCYEPPKGCKEAGPPPCASGAGVTFGSFNNAQKLSGATVRLWARLLRETPGSRLLLKGVAFSEEALRQDVLARFAAEGATNVEILPRAASTAEHLALYDRIDVGLDPMPYNGTTTTCEALWMGVPVVTLAGGTHAGRVGASLLTAVGLEELVATDEAGYVATAKALAADMPRLAAMRAGLRARVAGSPLCDGPGWCREFERVLGV